jgi:hypothetical protein
MTEEARLRLIEIAAMLALLVSVPALAVPKYEDMQRRRAASHVVADVDAVRNAVYRFYSDSAYFPPEAIEGGVPEVLAPYLPAEFSFDANYGRVEYRNWPIASIARNAAPEDTASARVIGLSVITKDPRIGVTAAALSPGVPQFTVGNRVTFVLFGS